MSFFTQAEIESKIRAISDAIDAVMTGQSYTMDTGQGKVTVNRTSLASLNKALEIWEQRLEDLTNDDGIISLRVGR